MSAKVYLETSIIGYLASRPSRDLIVAANQQLTREWWEDHREQYELDISQAVLTECCAGDPQAAQERLEILIDIPILDLSQTAEDLAQELVNRIPLPSKAAVDALHIAIATVHGIEYLLLIP